MIVEYLSSIGSSEISTDIVIIGGGPAGLTIAREFFGTSTRVLIVESGLLKEELSLSSLNSVESIGEPKGAAQTQKRIEFHGASAASWSNESQSFGVRCRVLGGSSHAWAGKSAAFDCTDFTARDWVPNSGWPFEREILDPYLDRAAEVLNLGPNCYDDALWDLIGVCPPKPQLDPAILRSFFWQFSRSRIDRLDITRFGPEFLTFDARNVRILLNATVTRIDTNEAGSAFKSLEVSTIEGVRSRVEAKVAILAAGGIENPRLLLASNATQADGLGNQNDNVGRYLMDHPGARIGRFEVSHMPAIVDRFGFFGVSHRSRSHMYTHGLALSPEIQKREQLLNCAAYILEERALDDPWDALKRLLRAKSNTPIADILAVASSPKLLAKGAGMHLLSSSKGPRRLKDLVINQVIKRFPNFVAREYRSRGLPHKLKGLTVDGITEQCPNRESRIILSDKRDALGVPLARVDWRICHEARRSLMRLGQLLAAELPRAGLPAPLLEEWIVKSRPQDSVIIDMGHTAGTTRMSNNAKSGVVDANCQVHGIKGLYIAGASVFPTCGHANPTLMILCLAIRLADCIKADLAR